MTAEDRLQSQCVKWLRLQYPNELIFAIPNGGTRNILEAVKLKQTGVLSGVADVFIALPNGKYHGLFVEFKVGKNKQTTTQREFEKIIKSKGYEYKVAYSLDEFIDIVTIYINNT